LWFPLLVCGMYHGYYHYNLWHMEAPRKLWLSTTEHSDESLIQNHLILRVKVVRYEKKYFDSKLNCNNLNWMHPVVYIYIYIWNSSTVATLWSSQKHYFYSKI
jgi:hypothetical protein